MIQNPAYKGKWKPPLIPNPDYDVSVVSSNSSSSVALLERRCE